VLVAPAQQDRVARLGFAWGELLSDEIARGRVLDQALAAPQGHEACCRRLQFRPQCCRIITQSRGAIQLTAGEGDVR
jgi:hypothetical protein